MRVFAISDLHVDYADNAKWVAGLSTSQYLDDILVVAGDVSYSLQQLEWALKTIAARFKKVLFVPGNHDLWVVNDDRATRSCLIAGWIIVLVDGRAIWRRPTLRRILKDSMM